MSQFDNKGMASDLSLGRSSPSAGAGTDSTTAAAAARHAAYLMQQVSAARNQHLELQEDAEYERNLIGGLESYVRALQGEREKLDAFRRELPICMGLLDDAIQATQEKLTKALASSRTIASEASYSGYGDPAYAAHIASKDGVHSTPSRERGANMYTWRGFSGSSCKEHDAPAAHASGDDDHHQFGKQQVQAAAPFKETPFGMMTTGHPTAPSHLHLINYPPPPPPSASINQMLLHSNFQQKDGTLFSQGNEMMRPQATMAKPEGFQNTLDFSCSRINEDDQHTMLQREAGNGYGGPVQYLEHVHNQEEAAASPTMMMSTSCSVTGNINGIANTLNGMATTPQTPRKARRCWSPELHQRFLHALHQLGGPQSATPKQIREVMHVEGLTNDEVKSHLQKFRLHTRRPTPSQASEPAQQPHHLVLFGGIWVPTSPAESTPAAQLAACQMAGAGHGTSSANQNPYMHVIGQNRMQALMRGASSEELEMHVGVETASEVDVARSEQSTSQNGGLDNNVHEEEDTEIHLGSKPREITSPIAKARYQ